MKSGLKPSPVNLLLLTCPHSLAPGMLGHLCGTQDGLVIGCSSPGEGTQALRLVPGEGHTVDVTYSFRKGRKEWHALGLSEGLPSGPAVIYAQSLGPGLHLDCLCP